MLGIVLRLLCVPEQDGLPVCFFITADEKQETITAALKQFKSYINADGKPPVSPSTSMTDESKAEHNAIRWVLRFCTPGIRVDCMQMARCSFVLNCILHSEPWLLIAGQYSPKPKQPFACSMRTQQPKRDCNKGSGVRAKTRLQHTLLSVTS